MSWAKEEEWSDMHNTCEDLRIELKETEHMLFEARKLAEKFRDSCQECNEWHAEPRDFTLPWEADDD